MVNITDDSFIYLEKNKFFRARTECGPLRVPNFDEVFFDRKKSIPAQERARGQIPHCAFAFDVRFCF